VLREADDEPMNVASLAEDLDESKDKLRKALNRMTDEGKLKKHNSISSQHGSTGPRYTLKSSAVDTEGKGLSL
jgi:predicted transcriptional regulator